MKTKNFSLRRISLFFVIPFLSLSLLVACSKDNSDNNDSENQMYTTQGNANGTQQNPPVSTTGTATLVGTYNSADNKWDYSISWSSLTGAASLIEVHGPADAGANGDILFSINITAGGSNGAASATTTLTEQQEDYLLAGRIYFTILTTAHVTGEVRGQVYPLIR